MGSITHEFFLTMKYFQTTVHGVYGIIFVAPSFLILEYQLVNLVSGLWNRT